MGYVTVYRMQAYRRWRGSLERHEASDFATPEEAAIQAHVLAPRRAAAVVFAVEIDSSTGQVGRVRMLSGYNTREVAIHEARELS